MVTAIALACTFTAGTNEGPRSGGREMMFHEPQSTRSGIMAALLAREDVQGSEEALEGPAGFYNAFTGNNRGELSYVFMGPNQVSFEPVAEGLGTRWELLHTVLKMYPTAGYNCPVIDLMTDIRRSHALAIDEIERITIDMNWLETLYPSPAFPNPSRGRALVGSTHYFAAYVAVNGSYPPLRTRIDPGDDAGAAAADNHDTVVSLMRKVDTVGHKDRPAFAPRITVEMTGGKRVPWRISRHGTGMGIECGDRAITPSVSSNKLAGRKAGSHCGCGARYPRCRQHWRTDRCRNAMKHASTTAPHIRF